MKIVAIGGEPGAGKSTLALALLRNILLRRGRRENFKAGLVSGMVFYPENDNYRNGSKLYIIGDYSDPKAICPGTDKLSMGVLPEFRGWLNGLYQGEHGDQEHIVFFEGDRLFNASLFHWCQHEARGRISLDISVLSPSKQTAARRLAARGSNQSETFLKGRATKIARIIQSFPVNLYSSEDDQAESLKTIFLEKLDLN